ncbi:hypothetical protein JKP76_11290 [Blastococcus sp. TML/C7B]|uniref:hypothetical protein n=1 Tax=Blastococcus sp. TML/C7B TaxID=2798728 RepID=UPI00190C72D9|nr:hypothetical protein [Blastococcus sp. TML/C7B]MBN1096565.1 hypothetical protein [Blastococcus sp. TML/C7B]
MSASDVPLFRTGTGGRRHIRGCSHLVGKPVIQAADTDGEICTLCERELRGEGRRYFASLAEALPEFGAARSNWPLIESHLSGVEHDQVWIVHSGSYIALGRGGRAVAWAGKTYVNPSAETLIELPDYRPGGGGGTAGVEVVRGDICEKHNMEKSRNGTCGMCDF